jgi:hypothetical protein
MKAITLRYGKEEINGQNTFFSTIGLLKITINNIPKESGIGVSEMAKRIRLLEILNQYPEYDVSESEFNESMLNMSKTINIEDSDYIKLKELFSEVKWKIVSRFITKLSEEFNSK